MAAGEKWVSVMSYHQTGAGLPEDHVCRYGPSKLQFRGPKRSLDGSHLACLGGDETFGRFVDKPFPAVLEQRLDRKCVNFGSLFCGLEALSRDTELLKLANAAELCVMQMPGALGQSNRFYKVHPHRNDRFLAPTDDLVALYPDLDFTDVHFVRHLLGRLHACSDARYEVVAQELRQKWTRTMQTLLQKIEPPVIMLCLRVEGEIALEHGGPLGCDPVFVGADMVEGLRPLCAGIVELSVRMSGDSDEIEDLLFGTLQQPMAEHMIGPASHRRIAEALYSSISDLN